MTITLTPFGFPQSLTEQKEAVVSAATEDKQFQLDPIHVLQQKLELERLRLSQIEPVEDYTLPAVYSDESLPAAAVRGVKEAAKGMGSLAYGLAAGGGAIAESAVGEGGFATQFKKAAVDKYIKTQDEMAKHSRPEDSFTYSYNKAKEGDFGAMVNWASHGTGYVTGQLATMLTGAGIIKTGVELTGKKAVTQLMGTLVRKEAARLAEKEALSATSDAVLKAATANVAKKVGEHIGMATMGVGMEGGEILGDLAKQTTENGENRSLTGEEIGKGLSATALAGAVEYVETLIGLKAIKGKLGKLPGSGVTETIDGIKGKAIRGAVTAGKVAPAEGAQEFVQTGIEQWGKGQDLNTEEAKTERIDAAALGALGGIPGGVGASFHGSISEQEKADKQEQFDKLIQAKTQHGYDEKVAAAVEAEDASVHLNPEKPEDFNPVAGIDTLHKINLKETTSPLTKMDNVEVAEQTYQNIQKQQASVLAQIQELDSKDTKDLTPEEVKKLDTQMTEYENLDKLLAEIEPTLKSMKQPDANAPDLLKKMQAAIADNDGESIQKTVREMFGSSGRIAFQTKEDYEKILSNPKISESDKKLIQRAQVLYESVDEHAAQAAIPRKKTVDGVTNDVMNGGKGNTGIANYHKKIQIALDHGKTDRAETELSKLNSFATRQSLKATTFRNILTAKENQEQISDEDQKNLDFFNTSRKVKYNIIPGNSNRMVKSIELEAAALQNAVAVGEDLIAPYKVTQASKQTPRKETVAENSKVSTAGPLDTGLSPDTADTQSSVPQNQGPAVSDAEDAPIQNKGPKSSISEVSVPTDVSMPELVQTEAEELNPAEVEALLNEVELSPKRTETEPKNNSLNSNIIKKPNKKQSFIKSNGESVEGTYYATEEIPGVEIVLYKNQNKNWKAIELHTGLSVDIGRPVITAKALKAQLAQFEKDNPGKIKKATEERLLKEAKPNTEELTEATGSKKASPEPKAEVKPNEIMGKTVNSEQVKKEDFVFKSDKDLSQMSSKALLAYWQGIDKQYRTVERRETVRKYGLLAKEKEQTPAKQTEAKAPVVESKEEIGPKIPMNQILVTQDPNKPDPNNKIKNTFRAKKIKGQRILQQTQNAIKAIHSFKLNFGKKLLTDKAAATIDSIEKFSAKFNTSLDATLKMFTEKGQVYRDNDPIQYLLQADGKLPINTAHAIMAASYKYLATRASETTFNTDEKILKMLGISEGHQVTPQAKKLLQRVGVTDSMLQEQLGQEIFQLLDIEAKPEADHDAQNRLEISLGLQAIAVMQHMGYLQQTRAMLGTTKDENSAESTRGYVGLKNQILGNAGDYSGIENSFFLEKNKGEWETPKQALYRQRAALQHQLQKPGNKEKIAAITAQIEQVKDEGIVDFYRVTTIPNPKTGYDDMLPEIENKISKPFKDSKDTWSLLFTGEKDKTSYSWEPIEYTMEELSRLKKTQENASEDQTANLQGYINEPHKVADRTMNFYLFLDQANREKVMGFKDLDKVHVDNLDSAKGVNFGLNQSYLKTMAWIFDAAQQMKGFASEFYVPGEFWRMGRMGMVGDINRQGDKAHRWLFNLVADEITFQLNDKVTIDLFMAAVGLSLDIEILKEGGLQNTIDKTKAKLATPVMQEAIKAIQTIMKKAGDVGKLDPVKMNKLGQTHPKEMAAITAGVEEGKMNVHTLKGLIEYARFLEAKDSFTTDLPLEVDGVANGPTIARYQMTPDEDLTETLAALQNSGISFRKDQEGLAEHHASPFNHDAYKTVGNAWGDALIKVEQDMLKAKSGIKDILRFQAMKNILGDFKDEEGHVNKIVRKLSKEPTMKTIFGMQEKTMLKELHVTVIDTIHETLEKVAKSKSQEEFDALRTNLNNLLGRDILADAATDPQKLLKVQLTKKDKDLIFSELADHHGEALSQAIERVYGRMKVVMKTLNTGINMVAALYNTTRKLAIQVKQKELGNQKLSVKDYKEIDTKLKKMFPHVKTAMGGIIPLAKLNRDKEYGQGHVVEQSYKSGTLSKKKGTPYKKSGLKRPGAAGAILPIHGFDSVVENLTMGEVWSHFLNIHDAAITNILSIGKIGQTLNKHFIEKMKEYNMAESMAEGVQESYQEYLKLTKEWLSDVPAIEFNAMLVKELKGAKIKKFQPANREKPLEINNKNVHYAIKFILDQMADTGQKVKANKNKLVDATVALEQYSIPGDKYETGNPESTELGLLPTDITTRTVNKLKADIVANKNIQENIKELLRLQTQQDVKLGTSPNPDFSTDPADYTLAGEVSGANVLQVYNQIKNDSNIQDDPEHDTHLQHILNDLITNVLQPVDIYLKSNPDKEPEGAFVPVTGAKDQVFISSQNQIIGPVVSGALNQGIRMSTGEVYTHELLHGTIHFGLDANQRLQHQVKMLYNLARKELGPDGYRAFLSNPDMDVKDPNNRYEVQAAKARFNYIFRSAPKSETIINEATGLEFEKAKSNHLHEFMTLALTNKHFLRAVRKIELKGTEYTKTSWKDIIGPNIQETLINIGRKLMEFFYHKYTQKNPASDMATELEALAIQLSKIDSQAKTRLFNTLQKVSNATGNLSPAANAFIKDAFNKAPILSTVGKIGTAVNVLKGSNTYLGQSMRNVVNAYDKLDQSIAKSIIQEVKGSTKRLAPFIKHIGRKKLFIDEARESTSATYKQAAAELFTKITDDQGKARDLTQEEKTSITKVLIKTDTSVLGSDGLLEMLQKPEEIQNKIDATMKKILADPELALHATYYKRATDALGHFMVHTEARSDEIVWPSVRVIAELKNTDQADTLSIEAADRAEIFVDKLASLSALQYTPSNQKKILEALMIADPEAIDGVLQMHKELKEQSLKYAFNGNKYLFEKGYTKQILNPNIKFEYGTLAEEAEFIRAGFTRSQYPITRDKADPTRHTDMYIYTSRTGRTNDYLSAGASMTGNRAHGVASAKIAEQLGLTSKEGIINNRKIINQKQSIIDSMADPKFSQGKVDGSFMIPQVDWKGNLKQYRYMMSEVTKDSYLEQVNDFDAILGSMAGQVIDKMRTPLINKELLEALKKLHDEEYHNNPGAYVEIGPYSTDPNLREIYYMLPDMTKQDLERIWGDKAMYVAKDVVTYAFGYRQFNIVESFTKDPKDRAKLEKLIVATMDLVMKPFGVKGVIAANNAELLAIQLAKIAKNNLIVKSLYITLDNLGSNMMYLRARGVSIPQIIKQGWEAIAMGTKYQADKQKLDKLEVQLKIGKRQKNKQSEIYDLENEIMQLKDSLTRNPVAKSIESGFMTQLVDDVDLVVGEGKFPTPLEKRIKKQTDKLPEMVQNVGKVLLLTEDTKAYKTLNNAVKMTDFIGRHILYNYYMDQIKVNVVKLDQLNKQILDPDTPSVKLKKLQKRKKALEAVIAKSPKNTEEAAASVTEEFINFNIPTHRTLEYLNKTGFFWFTKYGLRILKPIKNSAIDKPFDAAMSILMAGELGLDSVYNSIPGITKNTFSFVDNPISMFIDTLDTTVPASFFKAILSK